MTKIDNYLLCEQPSRLFFAKKTKFFAIFGNFVSKNHQNFIKIGNFVIKNFDFNPFLALAKNLTKWGRQTKSKQTTLKIGDQNHVSN